MTPEEILKQAQNAAKIASDKVAAKKTKVIEIPLLKLKLNKFEILIVHYIYFFKNMCY